LLTGEIAPSTPFAMLNPKECNAREGFEDRKGAARTTLEKRQGLAMTVNHNPKSLFPCACPSFHPVIHFLS